MAELPQRLGFDRKDPLAGNVEVLADFLERMVVLLADAEKRMRRTFSSRGVKVARALVVCSESEWLITDSDGDVCDLSSRKSPMWLSSSSPIGVSSEIGSTAVLGTLRTLSADNSIRTAIS